METTQSIQVDEKVLTDRSSLSPSLVLRGCQPADVSDPRMRRLFAYWQSKRSGNSFPARRALDPLDFRYVLGNVVLIDVQRPGPRFRYRLIGTNLLLRDGRDRTGQWIDELPSLEYRRTVLARLQDLADRPEPMFVRNIAVLDNKQYDYEALWLPLAADGEIVDMLMACQYHKPRPGQKTTQL